MTQFPCTAPRLLLGRLQRGDDLLDGFRGVRRPDPATELSL